MQRQVIRDGKPVYVDCGPSRARVRGDSRTLDPMPTGLRLPDFLFAHPAADVSKAPGEKASR